MSILRLDLQHASSKAWAKLKSLKLVCGDGLQYNISWFNYHNTEVVTSPLTEFHKEVEVGGLFLCSNYTAVVDIRNLNVLLHTFNQSTTTPYEGNKPLCVQYTIKTNTFYHSFWF